MYAEVSVDGITIREHNGLSKRRRRIVASCGALIETRPAIYSPLDPWVMRLGGIMSFKYGDKIKVTKNINEARVLIPAIGVVGTYIRDRGDGLHSLRFVPPFKTSVGGDVLEDPNHNYVTVRLKSDEFSAA